MNEKLQDVQWGEYRLGDIFDSATGDFDIQKKHINDRGEYVITAGLTNNGVLGKSDIKAKIFKSNTITVDMFGNTFFRYFKYKIVTHARVFTLLPKFQFNVKQGLFIVNLLKYLTFKFGYENMCSWAKIQNDMISLPEKNGKIDFQFMESFIAELEAYLTITGLKDYELTDEEKEVLEAFSEIRWKKYRMGDLFDKIKTNKLNYKAKDLPKEPLKGYVLPALTSSFMNQGLNYYVPKSGATVLKNVVSLPSNSDVYRAYYQSRDFTVLSDSYAIECKDSVARFTSNDYLFSVSCINKVTDLPIYSYKNKLGGWNVVKNKFIQLPINSSNGIDFEYMEVFTQAIKKLIIKDVVFYADEKIGATVQVANINQKYDRVNKDGLLKVAEEWKEYNGVNPNI